MTWVIKPQFADVIKYVLYYYAYFHSKPLCQTVVDLMIFCSEIVLKGVFISDFRFMGLGISLFFFIYAKYRSMAEWMDGLTDPGGQVTCQPLHTIKSVKLKEVQTRKYSPAMGGPTTAAVPWNSRSRPKAFVSLSRPSRSTSTTEVRPTYTPAHTYTQNEGTWCNMQTLICTCMWCYAVVFQFASMQQS